MRTRTIAFLLCSGLLASLACAADAPQSSDDAWPLYAKAAQRVQQGYREGVMSPAASSLVYPGYPPYPAEWKTMEKASYDFNAPARALVRQARSMNKADWPAPPPPGGKLDVSYLNGCRALANEVGDAA